VADILREISRMDGRELARDTGGTKNTAAFLTDLAELVPQEVYENIAVVSQWPTENKGMKKEKERVASPFHAFKSFHLLIIIFLKKTKVIPLMDCEAYSMRNAILGMMGTIVVRLLLADRSESGVAVGPPSLIVLLFHPVSKLFPTTLCCRLAISSWTFCSRGSTIPPHMSVAASCRSGGGRGRK
jgi:hypothetical protein